MRCGQPDPNSAPAVPVHSHSPPSSSATIAPPASRSTSNGPICRLSVLAGFTPSLSLGAVGVLERLLVGVGAGRLAGGDLERVQAHRLDGALLGLGQLLGEDRLIGEHDRREPTPVDDLGHVVAHAADPPALHGGSGRSRLDLQATVAVP